MIPLQRLPEPPVLASHRDDWRARFLAARASKPGKRPSSRQYAHADIVATLEAMSAHKCFYCEQSTKENGSEVDHYIEVAEAPERAFEWANLYLACPGCNHKEPNTSIPCAACLDPCDPGVRPEEHLNFDGDLVRANADSPRGRQTIQKYRLDRRELDLKRCRQLRQFDAARDAIKNKMIADGRHSMGAQELEVLRSFAQTERPFSLMFRIYFARVGLM